MFYGITLYNSVVFMFCKYSMKYKNIDKKLLLQKKFFLPPPSFHFCAWGFWSFLYIIAILMSQQALFINLALILMSKMHIQSVETPLGLISILIWQQSFSLKTWKIVGSTFDLKKKSISQLKRYQTLIRGVASEFFRQDKAYGVGVI